MFYNDEFIKFFRKFLKTFISTKRMQFWQLRWEIFYETPKFFRKMSVNDNKNINFFHKLLFFIRRFFRTSKFQFWQIRGKIFEKKAKKVSLKVQRWEKLQNRFGRNCSSSDCSFEHVKCSFDNISIFFRKNCEIFLHNVRQWFKDKVFQKTFFSPKFSYWHVECSSVNLTEKLSTTGQKIIDQCPKRLKLHKIFEIFFSTIYVLGHVQWQFDKPVKNISTRRQFFGSKSENDYKTIFVFFFKFSFHRMNPIDM